MMTPRASEYESVAAVSAVAEPLSETHRALIAASAISDVVRDARGYRTVTDPGELRRLGFSAAQARVPGLLVPLWRIEGPSGHFQAAGHFQYRPDSPRVIKGKIVKYETPRGQANVLDIPRTVFDALRKGQQAVFVTEGARKADALASLGIPVLNICGVYGWRGRNDEGGYTALADWESISVKGSIFVLAFDSDILTKPEVHQALARLRGFLLHRGAAKVRVLMLPPLLSGKTGVDDYIAATGATVQDLARIVVDDLPPSPEETVPEPDGEPVDLAALLHDVRAMITKYVVLSPHQADAITLWTAHSHAFDAAEATPYLAITSPEKRSGKTRLLEVLELVVRRPWLTGRTSAAALPRKVDKEQPTLLLDESDAAFKGDKEYAQALRGVLNSGHRRGGSATVCIGQGASIDFRNFSTFNPKAIAGIGNLPDTVADRSIPIILKRRASNEPVERFRRREAIAQATPLRDALARWAAGAVSELRDARPDIPDALDDRAADGLEPLLAIADLAGGEWPERARRAALALSAGEVHEDDSIGVRLLADIRIVFEEIGPDRASSSVLLERLWGIEEAPWGEWYGRPLTARGLAKLLKPFGIRPRTVRSGPETAKGYAVEDFADAWRRYAPPLSVTASHADFELKTDVSRQASSRRVTDSKAPEKGQIELNVTDVTDKTARIRGEQNGLEV